MDSITIKGYKSFKDITVPLNKINILIGSNGAGKSNFLSLFEFLGNAYEGFLARSAAQSGGIDKILHKGRKATDRISIKKFHFHDTGRKSPFTGESNIVNDSYHLYSQGDNIAAFLYGVKNSHPTVYHRIVMVIQSVAPFFHDFCLMPNESGGIRLQWKGMRRPHRPQLLLPQNVF